MPRARNAIRRRLPKQERSRRLVEAIVEAAQIVLAESGPDALTTVNVAQRAGVSVGSLYQYFAGRDALLFAVYEQELSRFRKAWRAWRTVEESRTTEQRIREGLALTLAHYRRLAALDPAFFLAHRAEIARAIAPRARAGAAGRERLGARDDLLRGRAVLKHARIERADVA
ncbi:MAG TPA: helix-turn-helix domain-containing protein, partial [Myxococcota bacterium]|nr:helix-turn-helix domain-containing protein [Myxococcota bacterium]